MVVPGLVFSILGSSYWVTACGNLGLGVLDTTVSASFRNLEWAISREMEAFGNLDTLLCSFSLFFRAKKKKIIINQKVIF